MLFNSPEFLFAFLPAVLAAYYYLASSGRRSILPLYMVLVSVVFYGWWSPKYLVLLAASIAFNWKMGALLQRTRDKRLLGLGVGTNLAALAVFKYTGFFISLVNMAAGSTVLTDPQIALPLGISFFTFTQIAFLVDVYRGEAHGYSAVDYALFVTFFPHLMAGPVLHHGEMMPQFEQMRSKQATSGEVAEGLWYLTIGLFKKVVVADTLARYVDPIYANLAHAQIVDVWTAAIAYTLQLYYDFSGYSEMAIGLGLMFGVRLPVNFNSPYKALNVSEFWKRWHITLSRFLQNYLYIPLGGNRHGRARMYTALFATMAIGGLWHGAGLTFILWGCMHGAFLIVHKIWQASRLKMPAAVARLVTLMCVVVAWVPFRATSLSDTLFMWKGMLGLNGVTLPSIYTFAKDMGVQVSMSPFTTGLELPVLLVGLLWAVETSNTSELWASTSRPGAKRFYTQIACWVAALFYLNQGGQFLYWTY